MIDFNNPFTDLFRDDPPDAQDSNAQNSSSPDGTDTPDDSTGVDSSGADTHTDTSQPTLWTLPTTGSSTSVARSQAKTNSIGIDDPEPIIQPQPTTWKGINPIWNVYFMREGGKRNKSTLTSLDNWQQNGCHPLCLATILDWWQYKNPDTQQNLEFPYPDDPDDADSSPTRPPEPPPGAAPNEDSLGDAVNPLFMCRRLFNKPFVPSLGQSGGTVDHIGLQNSVAGTDRKGSPLIDSDGNSVSGVTWTYKGQELTMQTATYTSDGPTNLALAIKYFLQFGPLMLLLSKPGHYVVAAGFRNNKMYICDSGDVIKNKKYWGHSNGVKSLGCGMVQVDVSHNDFVYNQGIDPNPEC